MLLHMEPSTDGGGNTGEEGTTGGTVGGKWGGVEVQQQEGVAGQKEMLRQPTMGDERSLIAAFDADDPEDKPATETLPTSLATRDRQAPFSTWWDPRPAACETPDKDNPVPSGMG